MRPAPVDTETLRFELVDAYTEYCNQVSPDNMAVSLRTATYLLSLCRSQDARVVTDFGSGFTSYVLAWYASHSEHDVTVRSVDDNEEWLEKTGKFLADRGLHSNLHLWDQYQQMPLRHDVACWDLGKGEVREAGMEFVADRTRPGGVVLFDDAQHSGHRQRMSAIAHERRWNLFFLQDDTQDQYGRLAALMVTP